MKSIVLACVALALVGCRQEDTTCTAVDNNSAVTVTCPNGSTIAFEPDGGCGVTMASDGTPTVTCDDGAATVPGGTSCAVADNGNGTTTVACDDGSETTFGGSSRWGRWVRWRRDQGPSFQVAFER